MNYIFYSYDMIICCMNPLLSRLSTSVGRRTFLGVCLSFLAFFMAMPRLPFHTSMLLDRSRPSNSGVLTARARDRAGAAMCMRSTPGCGTLAGPSLVLVDFRWSRLRDSQTFQVRNVPARLEDRTGPDSEACRRRGEVHLKRYDVHIPFIYLSYINAH